MKVKYFLMLFLIFLGVLFIGIDQNRNFYCLSTGECITVWKRIGSKCYILPYKYYGIFLPKDNYIVVPIDENPTGIIFDKKNILVSNYNNFKIINVQKTKYRIVNYSENKLLNDSLYTFKDGYHSKYKDSVKFMSVFVKENYTVSSNGRLE